jgi:hypothetical protein
MLMHKLLNLEIVKSRRVEVVGRVDVTWMDLDPWDLGHVLVGPKGKVDIARDGRSHLR